jgi:hypothetical protein
MNRQIEVVATWVAELFATPLAAVGELLIAGESTEIDRHRKSFPNDPTGLEAFVNHVHLGGAVEGFAPDRRFLTRLGADVIRVWAERMQALLRGRQVLFYIAGRTAKDMTLRFHIDRRDGRSWLDLADTEFLRREKVLFYRADENGLSQVVPATTRRVKLPPTSSRRRLAR